MVGPDVRVVDLEHRQLRRLVSLLLSGERTGSAGDAEDAGGVLVLFHEGPQVHKCVHDGRRIPPGAVPFESPADLPALRARYGAGVAVAFDQGVLAAIVDTWQATARFDDAYLEQMLALLHAVHGEIGRGLHVDPPGPLTRLRVPKARTLRRLQRMALPPERVAVLYGIELGEHGQRVAASIIVRQGANGQVDLITTDAHLEEAGLDATSWREDNVRVTRRIEEQLGRVHVSCFADVRVLREIVASGLSLEVVDRGLREGRLLFPQRPMWLRLLLNPWLRRLVRGALLRRLRRLAGTPASGGAEDPGTVRGV